MRSVDARRSWPAVLALLVLAPFFGEYVVGSLTLGQLPLLPLLVPLYGGGALLVREAVRRSGGRGWPALLLLGAAYGVVEAGLFDGSLFDPRHEGMDLTATPVPGIGISATYAPAFVVNHAVISIAVPIALVEALSADAARSRPWLRRRGLTGAVTLYAAGGLLIAADQWGDGAHPSPKQAALAVLTALGLVALALAVLHGPRQPPGARSAPHPRTVLAWAFLGSSAYAVVPASWGISSRPVDEDLLGGG